MRRFVLGWKKLKLDESLGTRIVTYADDLVILCRRGNAEEALIRMRELMGKLKLTVNEEKTRICTVPEGGFEFLGYSFGRLYKRTTGNAYLGMRPSKRWANYFQVGVTTTAYRAIDNYTTMRLSRWLRNKHKNRRRGIGGFPTSYLYETLGLVRLTRLGRSNSWAKA